MRYTFSMRGKRSGSNPLLTSSVFIAKSQKTVPFLPGFMFAVLGIVLLVAPRLVLGAVAVVLLLFGALLSYVAYKFMMLRKQVNDLAKSVEGSLYTGSFRGSKPDIDISDPDSTKIVYH